MASRTGRMVEGTDGADFQNRETIASQYQVSAKNKGKLKMFVLIHWMLGGVHLLRLLPAHLSPLPPTPPPTEYEYVWLASLVFTLIAMSASRRSKASGLNVFQFGVLGLGVCPLLMTLFLNSPDVLQFLTTGSSKGLFLWNDLPFAVLWSGFCFNCVVIHVAEICVARTLMAAWAPRHGKHHKS